MGKSNKELLVEMEKDEREYMAIKERRRLSRAAYFTATGKAYLVSAKDQGANAREAIISSPEAILASFHDQYKPQYNEALSSLWVIDTECWCWEGPSQGGQPRFGLGSLTPPKTVYARRWAMYNIRGHDLPKQKRLKRTNLCDELCTNPFHHCVLIDDETFLIDYDSLGHHVLGGK